MKLIKYIGMHVRKAMTVIAVLDSAGKVLAEAIIETKASTIVDFIKSQRGTLHVVFEEETQAAMADSKVLIGFPGVVGIHVGGGCGARCPSPLDMTEFLPKRLKR